MFADDQPNAVALGDSNTWAFGPAWVDALVALGWAREQLVLSYRSGTKPRHWLPKSHRLHDKRHGVMLDRKANAGAVAVHDALSPLTKLVIVGLGGNMIPGTRDDLSGSALAAVIERLAPFARIVWRGTPPSTATRGGKVAPARVRIGRYRRNAVLKADLSRIDFIPLPDRGCLLAQTRIYLDLLALHATGPAPGVRPLGSGREVDFEAEQALVATLSKDKFAKDEVATRGPWVSFVKARDSKQSHVPRDTAADFVALVAKRGVLRTAKRNPKLPLRMRVVDPRALLRRGAPRYSAIKGALVAPDTPVILDRWVGRYGHITHAETGDELGWTARINLELDTP